jgi:hypothetical protein
MKSKEEIEQLAEQSNVERGIDSAKSMLEREYVLGYTTAYTQCQEDMLKILKEEIKRAFIHGQGNAQMMEAGLERDEVEEYSNWRMLSINKQG